MTTVEGVQIPMTKNATVMWRKYEVASRAGILLLSPECDSVTSEVLVEHPDYMPPGEELGRGTRAIVFAPQSQPDVAIKVFTEPTPGADFEGTIADLYVNAALHYGLERIRQPNERWQMRAPRMLGAFLPEEALTFPILGYEDVMIPSVFAMEHIRPVTKSTKRMSRLPAFPSARERRWLIGEATKEHGLVCGEHDSCDGTYDNLMIEKYPDSSSPGVIVTYDNAADRKAVDFHPLRLIQ